MYKEISKCRICGNTNLVEILNLGEQALTGVFPHDKNIDVEKSPLVLVKCIQNSEAEESCGLVQLKHSHSPSEMYGENYGYRSGLNRFMVEHLQNKVKKIEGIAQLKKGDIVIDIGSNDGTLLRAYESQDIRLIGIDPSGIKFKEYYPENAELIPNFFTQNVIKSLIGEQCAKVITSIAMFYDLDEPLSFVKDIYNTLTEDGIWVFEQSYLPLMLDRNSYDTICHEHLEYYSLGQITWMLSKVGFTIIEVEFNDINGGSFSVIATKDKSKEESLSVRAILKEEEKKQYHNLMPYLEFQNNIEQHRGELLKLLQELKLDGKLVIGYGASTKGNVLLQHCGITEELIPYIAEVNSDKFGAFTPGTKIPIISEKSAKDMNPDYFIILPWHFSKMIIEKESDFLNNAGKILVPLPFIDIIQEARPNEK